MACDSGGRGLQAVGIGTRLRTRSGLRYTARRAIRNSSNDSLSAGPMVRRRAAGPSTDLAPGLIQTRREGCGRSQGSTRSLQRLGLMPTHATGVVHDWRNRHFEAALHLAPSRCRRRVAQQRQQTDPTGRSDLQRCRSPGRLWPPIAVTPLLPAAA